MGETFKFKMGASVTDRLTGFEGVVVGRADYLLDTNSYCVRPRTLDDGKMLDAHWINEGRLELLNATIFEVDFPK